MTEKAKGLIKKLLKQTENTNEAFWIYARDSSSSRNNSYLIYHRVGVVIWTYMIFILHVKKGFFLSSIFYPVFILLCFNHFTYWYHCFLYLNIFISNSLRLLLPIQVALHQFQLISSLIHVVGLQIKLYFKGLKKIRLMNYDVRFM